MNRILSYMPGGVKLSHYKPWKFCEYCGFCHDPDFKRCLRLGIYRMQRKKTK
jgi:hypothetical protein